jgi:hypothetical protein
MVYMEVSIVVVCIVYIVVSRAYVNASPEKDAIHDRRERLVNIYDTILYYIVWSESLLGWLKVGLKIWLSYSEIEVWISDINLTSRKCASLRFYVK